MSTCPEALDPRAFSHSKRLPRALNRALKEITSVSRSHLDALLGLFWGGPLGPSLTDPLWLEGLVSSKALFLSKTQGPMFSSRICTFGRVAKHLLKRLHDVVSSTQDRFSLCAWHLRLQGGEEGRIQVPSRLAHRVGGVLGRV